MFLKLPSIELLRQTLENYSDNLGFFICMFILIPIVMLCCAITLYLIFRKIKNLENKTKHMREISRYIRDGARIYLQKQAKMLSIILTILFIPVGLTGLEFLNIPLLSLIITGVIFLLGAFSSMVAGYIGMISATKTNILVLEASIDDPNEGFKLAYYGGMITGILNISLFVIGIWLIFLFTGANIYLMVGYSFGASIMSLLAQVGGGIYTKSADIGADLVGKYEYNIKEDDPRNPAVIADLVGDNVGDCAGRGADLFESASSDVIGGMILGLGLFLFLGDPIFIITDITLISLGMLSLFFTVPFLKINFENTSRSIWRVFISATGLNILILFVFNLLLFGLAGIFLFLASLLGLIAVFITIILTVYYTSIEHRPTRKVARASEDSPSLNIISGLSTGFSSSAGPIMVFILGFSGAFIFGTIFGSIILDTLGVFPISMLGSPINPKIFILNFGIWGVNMASVSSDTIISTILSFDTFGPILDNAAGIAQMGEEKDRTPKDLRQNLDKLDAVGNTTKAVAKGFALVCGGFSSIVMFLTFLTSTSTLATDFNTIIPRNQLVNIFDFIVLHNPLIIGGLFIGVLLPVIFSAFILSAVQKGAQDMVAEVRNQFKTIPGLIEGRAVPNYEHCIKLSARNALRYMVKPVFTVIIIVIIIGILFGPIVTGALLIGNLIGCLLFGIFMSVSGAVFDNAKKGIENGLHGGNNSAAHKAAIIGDTVGDPLKDAAGPSMNIIITTINTLSITFLPIFLISGFLFVA
ncbi:MAG: K(+)-insensitive pyrophosphate-energized proton pump [Promethearchaeota archaeon]|nr:MAG: K(+)-insensitive pyrophosphate-energized proton pump [Candidatus Lokiarchaeota archaeon]